MAQQLRENLTKFRTFLRYILTGALPRKNQCAVSSDKAPHVKAALLPPHTFSLLKQLQTMLHANSLFLQSVKSFTSQNSQTTTSETSQTLCSASWFWMMVPALFHEKYTFVFLPLLPPPPPSLCCLSSSGYRLGTDSEWQPDWEETSVKTQSEGNIQQTQTADIDFTAVTVPR